MKTYIVKITEADGSVWETAVTAASSVDAGLAVLDELQRMVKLDARLAA